MPVRCSIASMREQALPQSIDASTIMLEAIQSLASLCWLSQSPQFRPLPNHIERVFVNTPSGDLELLISRPGESSGHNSPPPVLFAHGGYGSAGVWLEWMDYLHKSGYKGTLYAGSLRNHGGSYSVPFYRMVWRTPLDACAGDLLACIQHAQQDAQCEHLAVVGHSSGGGLLQYLLANSRFRARALCLLDAIPHFGSYGVYWNWFKTDPWFPLRGWLHLQHPTSPLSSDRLVQQAFFGRRFPQAMVPGFRRWMPAYESMGWPLGMFGSFWAWWKGTPKWLDARDIIRNISHSTGGNQHTRICIMVGGEDMMIDTDMCRSQAAQFRDVLEEEGRFSSDLGKNQSKAADIEGVETADAGGVRLVIVEGAGHHLQNDVQRDQGAQALHRFLE